MKLALFMSVLCVFTSFGSSFSQQKVNMNLGTTTIKEALTEFQRVTNKIVIYSDDNFETTRKVLANFKDVELEEFLKTLLKGSGMTYKLMEDYILIVPSKASAVDSLNALKKFVLKGVVKDEKGVNIPGVTVLIKGTKVGVATDVEGKFELTVTDTNKLVLVFSFVGMKTMEVKYTGQKLPIKVVMKEAVGELEDVVVTGYNVMKKSSFTGNAVSLNQADLLKVSKTNVIQALQTFDPSFRIKTNNQWGSDPNALPEMYIRGQSGIGIADMDKNALSKSTLKNNPNLPVFIMDGFEVSVEKVYDMDPNRINSLTILKDAAATAMYGSRAANGVVVITTVAPKPGEVRVSYNLVGSVTIPDLRDYNLMNAAEKVEAERAAGLYVPNNETIPDWTEQIELDQEYMAKMENVLRGVDTYWLSKPLKTALNHKHSLYLEGGSETILFGVDVLYNNQDGVMKGSLRDRIGIGFVIDYRMKNLQIRNYVSYQVMKSEESPYGSFSDYASKLPYDEYKDKDGRLLKKLKRWNSYVNTKNPLYEATVGNYTKDSYTELIDNLSLNWYITKTLQLKGQLSVIKKDTEYKDFIHPQSGKNTIEQDVSNVLTGELRLRDGESLSFNSNVVLAYNQNIEKHNINFTAGMNVKTEAMNDGSSYYRGFPSGNLDSPSFAKEIVEKPTFTDNKTRLLGLLAILNYSYDNIYLLDMSCRTDGSSEFGADRRFAPFWSGGVGINLHNYKFFEDNGFVNLLKVRGSFGQTGKVNFPPYCAISSHNMYIDKWYITGVASTLMSYMGNEDLQWERTNKLDVGFELGLLNNLFYVKASYYRERTKDLITDVTTPSSSGFISYKSNLGEVENKGFEVDVKADLVNDKDMYVSLWANIGHNENKLLKVSDALKAYNKRVDEYYKKSKNDQSRSFTKYEEGVSLTAKYGMKSLGIDPVNGKELFIYKDNHTVSYDWSAPEMSVIGDELPWGQGAFGLNFRYKGLTLFASFMYEFGGDYYNYTLINNVENADIFGSNVDKRVALERWRKPGDVTTLKNIADREETTKPTSRFMQKNNVLSLNALTLGYEFDPQWLRKFHLNQLRFEVSANDIWRLSTVKAERGLSYPFAQTINFSMKLDF